MARLRAFGGPIALAILIALCWTSASSPSSLAQQPASGDTKALAAAIDELTKELIKLRATGDHSMASAKPMKGVVKFADGKERAFADLCGLEPTTSPLARFVRRPGYLVFEAYYPRRDVHLLLDEVTRIKIGPKEQGDPTGKVIATFTAEVESAKGKKESFKCHLLRLDIRWAESPAIERFAEMYASAREEEMPFFGATITLAK